MSEARFRYSRTTAEEKKNLLILLKNELQSAEDIVFAYVLGSFIELEVSRDIDVAIWVRSPQKAFSHEVDLSAKLEAKLRTGVDLHVLNQAPLPFRYSVFTRGRLLFSRDEEARTRIVDETIRQYLDLRALRIASTPNNS